MHFLKVKCVKFYFGLARIAKAINAISKPVKLIAMLILALLSSLAVFWSSSAIIPIVACIGGVFAFFGLLIEDEAAKDEKKQTPEIFVADVSIAKAKGRFGWWVLMLGIAIEIGVAFWSAYRDDLHIRQMAKAQEDADPRNQPINAISGYAIVEVRANGEREINLAKNLHQIEVNSLVNFDTTPSEKMRQNPESVELVFGRSPNDSPAEPTGSDIVLVGWIDSVNTVVDDSKPYIPNFCFILQFSGSGLWNPDSVTFKELKFAQIEGIGNAGEVQPPLEVIGGEIGLKVNLDWPKTFHLPNQTNQFWRVSSFETNDAFIPAGYGNLTNEPAAK